MFVLTVVFGIFHGLLLLPVILSVAGPVHHDNHQESDSDTDSTNSDSYSSSTGFDNKAFTHNAVTIWKSKNFINLRFYCFTGFEYKA